MDWLQLFTFALTVIGSTFGCCWYFRKETKEQIAKLESEQQEFRQETRTFQNNFQNEVKSFHGRLCTLEERYLQLVMHHEEKRTQALLAALRKGG